MPEGRARRGQIPSAYKPIEEVIEKSSDLVEVVTFIRQCDLRQRMTMSVSMS